MNPAHTLTPYFFGRALTTLPRKLVALNRYSLHIYTRTYIEEYCMQLVVERCINIVAVNTPNTLNFSAKELWKLTQNCSYFQT